MQNPQQQQQSQNPQQPGIPGGAPNGVAGGTQMPQSPGHQQFGPGGSGGPNRAQVNGGRFDFDDGGTYCGGWEDGKAHGHGVCTGPKGQGAYSGSWHFGFEVSGVYTWPSGSCYEGQWQNGKRHGLGMETRGRWLYRGEWTQGFKGRYGVRQSTTSTAKYEGTWSSGLQDGYGSETYADSGTYQGQWLRGMRHGYGVRASAPFGLASHYKPTGKGVRASLTSLRSTEGAPGTAPTPEPTDRRDRRVDDSRGGFVLKARSDDPPARRKSLTEKSLKKGILAGLKIRKQRSTGDLEKRGTAGSIRSNASTASWMSTESSQSQASASMHTDSNASFVIEDEQMDASVTETYLGEWKNDKRTGFGVSERSDGLRYEGEWFNNRKYGYGVTTFRDNSKEEGKYKNNVLITSQKKKHLFLIRSAKFRERIDAAVAAAQRASKIALQKADIAISRTATARGKAELADIAAEHAREDSELAQQTARQFAPDFRQPGLERLKNRDIPKYVPPPQDAMPGKSILHKGSSLDQQNTTPMKQQQPQQLAQQPVGADGLDSGGATGAVSQVLRRASMKPLPQNTLTLADLMPQNQSSNPYSAQNQLPGSPSSQSSPSNPYSPQMTLPQNQFPTSSTPPAMTMYQQQQQQYQAGQYGQQNPYGATQYGQSQYPSSQNVDQYGNYGQGFQNQYQTQPGYANQQPPIPNQYGYTPMMNQMNQYSPTAQQQQTTYNPRLDQMQQQFQSAENQQRLPNTTSIRRNSRILSPQDRPAPGGIGQTLNDRLDHYKRPPSRDSSVDRYRRHPLVSGSRQTSVDKMAPSPTPDIPDNRSIRSPSALRLGTPLNGSVLGSGTATPSYAASQSSQFEDVLIKNKGLGQEILPSPGQPKRTESLYVTPGRGGGGGGGGGGSGGGGGGIKDWFSRQQLVMLVLFINISLALMFIKLLT
ncbi:junctophilin-1 isoform X6 [Nasonia vitripennis]|uniref:Junctophilin n=1 Tax=Nasonia vitripennis TaxID=7425 RepID=A0A7M7QUY2_NASVI|nr:junctophilin-1 isoform X6 [Nasonia vitripennis]